MRVLLVTSMFPPYCGGGVSSHVQCLAVALSKLGHEVWVLSSRRGQRVNPDEATYAPPGSHAVYARDFRGMAMRIGRLLREERFDVVHFHAFNALALALLCRGACTATVFTLHSDSANYLASVRGWRPGHPLYRALLLYERLAIRWPDATIAVSKRMEAYGTAIGGTHIAAIPNAVDSDYWTPGRAPSNGRPPTILVPRMHVPKNGIEYAIEAMAQIALVSQNVRMLVTGDGPLRTTLEERARRVAADSISFPGMLTQEQLRELYRGVDVVVIPSITTSGTQENTSIAALEAMACGKPVIATNIGGLPEVIPDGEAGFLIPEKDSNALARAAIALLQDRELAQRMGKEARDHVVSGFSSISWARKVVDVYVMATESVYPAASPVERER